MNRVTQDAIEALVSGGPSNVRLTQEAREALVRGGPSNVRLTQLAIEVLGSVIAPLTLSCNNPQAALLGVPYAHPFPADGGIPPYRFSISAGNLPPGITLDPATGVISGTPLANIVRLDPTTRNDQGAAIESFWESGLARGRNEIISRMIRVGNLDIWIRGNGTLNTTVYGPDKVLSVNPELMSGSGVPASLSPAPGIMYQEKFDLAHVENYTVRVGTNAVDAWWELSELTGYTKADLSNR